MKTVITIMTLVLLMSSTAMAQSTRPIENPHGLTVFGYATEFTPDHFEGIGSDQLYIVDVNGNAYEYLPRPQLGEVNGEIPMAELTQAQVDRSRREHYELEDAVIKYSTDLETFKQVMENKDGVVEVRLIAADCIQVIYENGEYEEVSFWSCNNNSLKIAPRQTPQEIWMQKLQDDLNAGLTVWFGTSHYRTDKATPEELQDFRNAVTELRARRELSDKQLNTPAAHEGVKLDALR